MKRPLKMVIAASVTVLALGTLAACGSSDDTHPGHDSNPGMMNGDRPRMGNGSEVEDGFNAADVAFAQGMIPHHQQALDMVELAAGRTLSPRARAIVEGIAAAQAPEIETMTGWLKAWGKSVPTMSSGGEDMGMDHMSGGTMPGMMSHDQMMQLDSSADASFERMWLQMMITHHEGAVEMANTEVESGRYRPAIDLAQAIVDGQEKEISQMKDLLKR